MLTAKTFHDLMTTRQHQLVRTVTQARAGCCPNAPSAEALADVEHEVGVLASAVQGAWARECRPGPLGSWESVGEGLGRIVLGGGPRPPVERARALALLRDARFFYLSLGEAVQLPPADVLRWQQFVERFFECAERGLAPSE